MLLSVKLSAESKQLYANKQRNLSKRSMFLRSLLKYFNKQTQAKIYQGKYRYLGNNVLNLLPKKGCAVRSQMAASWYDRASSQEPN